MPYHNTGGHFIDWSLSYLSGQKQTWVNGAIIDLPDAIAPDSKNFHHHKINMIHGFQNCQQLVHNVSQLPVSSVNVYLTPLPLHQVLDQLFGVSVEQANTKQMHQANEYIDQDTQQMITWLQINNHRVAFFDYKDLDYLSVFYNNRAVFNYYNQPLATSEEFWNLYTNSFFKKSTEQFDDEIWDRREQLALIVQVDKGIDFVPMINHALSHLYYNNDDVWNDLLNVVKEMLDFFNLEFQQDRLESWQSVYNAWRTKHDPYFARHFDRIVKAIVNNEYLSLTRFNLNFYKEVLIQRELIIKYNLNLKTWQLSKFPNNTQELHKLLEPNIHAV